MLGAEDGFIQASARKAISGEDESRRSQSSMACLWTEWVLRRMHLRWLRSALAGGAAARGLVKLLLRQEKGPWMSFCEAWKQVADRPVLSVVESVGVIVAPGDVAVTGAGRSGAGRCPGVDGRRRACHWHASGIKKGRWEGGAAGRREAGAEREWVPEGGRAAGDAVAG
ncbi:hypothetical protein NDU88_001951 [Pleurodeles waltl]|uniref:Uncharacterized protein n=1 Tax=Pleurodeles waltl TaxID=8319 RepID=A0AAV7T1I4_PLEWA|nr:hypothetical protein NDU88_001951 [Pleurodeles waltl]